MAKRKVRVQAGALVAPNANRSKKVRVKQSSLNRNRPNKQGNNKAGKKSNKGKSTPTSASYKYKGVYQPRETLEGPRLRNAVQQVVNLQTRPALRQSNRLIKEIEDQRDYEVNKQATLGEQAGRNASEYYKRLATEEASRLQGIQAAGSVLTGSVAKSGQDTLSAISQAGTTAQEGIGGYEGQSIGARDRLAEMIAMQGSTAAQQNNALNAQAQGTAANYQGLLATMAGASQMRGGEQMGDIRRQILSQAGDITQQRGQEIGQARNAKLELLLQRPELAKSALKELRESERNFLLSKGALGLEKKKLKGEMAGETGGVAYSNVNTKNLIKLKKLEHRQRLQELAASGATYSQLQEQKAQDSKEIIGLQQKGYGKDNGAYEGYQSFSKTFSHLRGLVAHPGDLVEGIKAKGESKSGKQVRKAAYDKLRDFGATDAVAKKAIRKLAKQYKKRQQKKELANKLPEIF